MVWYRYIPAGAVSGDYCDLIAGDGNVVFLVGDVSGKGVAASLLMSQLHAIFRSLSPFSTAVNELVGRANRVFCENTLSTHYATLVCGSASASGEVTVCNAGHCPPLAVGTAGVTAIEPTSLPLGLFCETEYSRTENPCAHAELRVVVRWDSLRMHSAVGFGEITSGLGWSSL